MKHGSTAKNEARKHGIIQSTGARENIEAREHGKHGILK